MERIYLDTNVWCHLFEPGNDPVRPLLLKAARGASVKVEAGLAVLEELAGLYKGNPSLYLKIHTFIKQVIAHRVLRDRRDLVHTEVAERCPLAESERYLGRTKRLAMWSNTRRRTFINGIAAGAKQRRENFKRDDERRRKQVLAHVGTSKPSLPELKTKWWPDIQAHIDDWARDYLRGSKALLHLPNDEALWPVPADLPTLRNFCAYKMTRIYQNVGEGKTIKPSDDYDAEHYANAAYADVLVTDDGPFSETCGLIGRPGLVVEQLPAFMNRLQAAGP